MLASCEPSLPSPSSSQVRACECVKTREREFVRACVKVRIRKEKSKRNIAKARDNAKKRGKSIQKTIVCTKAFENMYEYFLNLNEGTCRRVRDELRCVCLQT